MSTMSLPSVSSFWAEGLVGTWSEPTGSNSKVASLELLSRLPERQGVGLGEEVGHELVMVGHGLAIKAS